MTDGFDQSKVLYMAWSTDAETGALLNEVLGMELTAQQSNALWAAALTELANTIRAGTCETPTHIDIWTHDVPMDRLVDYAHNAYRTDLPFNINKVSVSVRVPTGEPLGLSVDWYLIRSTRGEDGAEVITTAEEHNAICVNTPVDDAETIARVLQS